MGVVALDGRDDWGWSRFEGGGLEARCEATEARWESVSTRRANARDVDVVGGITAAAGSTRRRFGERSSIGDCGDWCRRMGLSVPALIRAGTNGCESGTTLGGVPQESDCVRLMGRLPRRGGVAVEGAVCGLSCGEERRIGGVRTHKVEPARCWSSWPDAL